jgi:hypothetical protein
MYMTMGDITASEPISTAEQVLDEIENFIINSNAVTRGKTHLYRIIKQLAFSKRRRERLCALEIFLNEHTHFNMAGYVAFRMGDMHLELDNLLYALVKRHLLFS